MIRNAKQTFHLPVAVIFKTATAIVITFLFTGCFTGIESTPKITEKDVQRQNIAVRKESGLLDNINIQRPIEWSSGKQFYVNDERINRVLKSPLKNEDSMVGQILVLDRIDTVSSLTGETVVDLKFKDSSGTIYTYPTGLAFQKWKTLDQYRIPFMTELDLVSTIKDAFINRQFYYLTSRRLDENGNDTEGLRYEPVTIIDVVPGDSFYPARVCFDDNEGNHYSAYITLGNETNSIRNFETLFSTSDPRKNYPRISDEVWNKIRHSQVQLGMTSEECKLALGSPDTYTRIPSTAGMIEYWSFGNGRYLTFEEGVLVKYRL